MGVLDFLFPKRCINCRKYGEFVCAECFVFLSFHKQAICLVCNRQTYTGLTHPACQGRYIIDGAFSALTFNPLVRKLIYHFKYNPYISGLKEFLGELFVDSLQQNEVFFSIKQDDALLVPIPLHTFRLRARGYNQSLILAQELEKGLQLPVVQLLERQKLTASQTKLNREQRRLNVKDAFRLSKQSMPSDTIFLVDDVLTSGATLSEAAAVLKRAGAKKVYGLTLAHGQ